MSIDTSKNNFGFAQLNGSSDKIPILGLAVYYNDKVDATTAVLALEEGSFVVARYEGRVTAQDIFQGGAVATDKLALSPETMSIVMMAAGAMSSHLTDLGIEAHRLVDTMKPELWERAQNAGRLHTQMITDQGPEAAGEGADEPDASDSQTIVVDDESAPLF